MKHCNLVFRDKHVLYQKKGVCIDGLEREDVVKYRSKFIRKMVAMGFINEENAPTPEVKPSLPMNLECPPPEMLEKTIVIFHDESIFSANED